MHGLGTGYTKLKTASDHAFGDTNSCYIYILYGWSTIITSCVWAQGFRNNQYKIS